MITLQELCQYLQEILQPSLYADACPNGLQVEGTKEITKIATAVSASLATIEAAVKLNVQALIVHHGIFWSKDSYVIEGSKKEKIKMLLDSGISLIGYHLPLDAHEQLGNNWKAAADLGWTDLKPFCKINGMPIGVKGSFKPTPREQFQKSIENYYQHPATAALGGKDVVSSAALISGGAYRYLLDAVSIGTDCFITGNFDEPAWHQAHEEKINFFALGHSATERIGPIALGKNLEEQFGLECPFIDIWNPF